MFTDQGKPRAIVINNSRLISNRARVGGAAVAVALDLDGRRWRNQAPDRASQLRHDL
jgi:hypothetical protein